MTNVPKTVYNDSDEGRAFELNKIVTKNVRAMLDQTKEAIKDAILEDVKDLVLVIESPVAPIPGKGAAKVVKAFTEDVKKMLNNQPTEVETNGN